MSRPFDGLLLSILYFPPALMHDFKRAPKKKEPANDPNSEKAVKAVYKSGLKLRPKFPRPVQKTGAETANPGPNKQGETMAFFSFRVPEGLGLSDPIFSRPVQKAV